MLRRDQSCELIAFQILQFVDKDNDSSIGLPCGAPNLFQQCRQVNLKIAIVGQPGLRRLTPVCGRVTTSENILLATVHKQLQLPQPRRKPVFFRPHCYTPGESARTRKDSSKMATPLSRNTPPDPPVPLLRLQNSRIGFERANCPQRQPMAPMSQPTGNYPGPALRR